MREILFRGKTKNGEWCEGLPTRKSPLDKEVNRIQLLNDYYENDFTELFLVRDVLPETVGQYTGLTDKNGKKIFEGDILPIYEQGEEYIYKVIYNGDCFMLAMLDSEQGSYPLSIKNTISEVIGNIHDNPELLKGE